MSDPGTLTRFFIKSLHGTSDIDATIKNNTLIIVGENGSGKTTFLRILFHFLSGRFRSLIQFKFDYIQAIIGNTTINLSYGDLQSSYRGYDSSLLRNAPPSIRSRVREAEAAGRYDEAAMILESVYGRAAHHAQGHLFDEDIFERITATQSTVTNLIDAQILYLPTYRRIERELSSIFSGMDIEDVRRNRRQHIPQDTDEAFIELVEFGMSDVQRAIDTTLEQIRGFANAGLNALTLSYLGDVVNRAYLATAHQEIMDASQETVSAVLNRVGHTILNAEHKQHLLDILLASKDTTNVPSEHEQIIYHYFTKLLRFQSQLQDRERNIKQFCALCSTYILDKVFVYDSQKFAFRIEWSNQSMKNRKIDLPTQNETGDVKLSDLSSGEKQIVSLFSHMYLSGLNKFFVLIDEPELSLSVPWQRRFLEDIRQGSFCKGLIAVTHSPFIYDNSLRKNTHALGEFVRGPDWGNIQ